MKIAYYCSNRIPFPAPNNVVAANMEVMTNIIEGMVARGHDVTVYASKNSFFPGTKVIDLGLTAHKLDEAYEHEEWVKDVHAGYRLTYMAQIMKESDKYDIIHLHVGRVIYGMPLVKFSKSPVVFTIHENLESPLKTIMEQHSDANLISISLRQRQTMPNLNYVANIYHGVKAENFPFNAVPKDYYLFLSRLAKQKGVEFAIKAAYDAKVKLEIYGPGDEAYLRDAVYPHLSEKIKYLGLAEKHSPKWFNAFKNAKALVLPVQWEEPFGLVMIEAMACGTPIIAYNRGSVSEIVKDGETGFVCDPKDPNSLSQAIRKIEEMPQDQYLKMRQSCRQHIENNFNFNRMIDQYEKLYLDLINN